MNSIKLIGALRDELSFLYEFNNERFYTSYIDSERTSGTIDTLPVIVSEYAANLARFSPGDILEISGECRTRNENGKVRVFIFANDVNESDSQIDENRVEVIGTLCKKPIYRMTPLGREITDLILAVRRRHGTDYLPCVAWSRNARHVSNLEVGDIVEIEGRFQSREYSKGVAYEISVITLSDRAIT